MAGLLHTDSLAATVDAVNAAFFYGARTTGAERAAAAKWIASRQGLPGSYADMFAMTEADVALGVRLFTGQDIGSGGGARHILGEEACRALLLLGVTAPTVRKALQRATAGMTERLLRYSLQTGTYCCGRCTPSVWRHLTAGGLRDARPERLLAAGLRTLKSARLGTGKWRRYRFHYTLLALSEMDSRAAVAEMRYAAPLCERMLKRAAPDDEYARRRRAVAERVLAKC
jgi:hypothetical protein